MNRHRNSQHRRREVVMNSIYWLYIAVFILFIFLIVVLLFKRKPKRKQSIQVEYISGLRAMISGDMDRALERLRSVVRRDTDYIDAYILIGNIFREKKMYENAVKVHRDLLVRPNLNTEQQKSILSSLVLNYKYNNQPKWALSTCDKILELDKKNQFARDTKIGLYEDMGDWQGAFDILKKTNATDKARKNARLAAYKIEQGLQFVDLKEEHDARLRFREAIKQDNTCFAAYEQLVHSYIRENRDKDALKELKRLIQAVPDFADIAIKEFEGLLYDMGQFDEIENFYKQILQTNPKLTAAALALAEIYEKKGELVTAGEYARKVLQYDPGNAKIILFLIQIENKLRRYESSAQLATQLSKAWGDHKFVFSCSTCQHEQEKYFWRCPACQSWNSARRI
jgi:lipopolysaccharide biosynthesis regulator YciM